MPYQATVLYGRPDDPAAFDEHYETVHMPLARRMRGLTGWTVTRLEPDADGAAPPYYLIAELYAEDRASLLAAFDSPEGRAAARDVELFATGGATFCFGEVRTIIPPAHVRGETK